MSVQLVVTVIARDKPGIVERLSQTIADAGASWLGSRMTRLAGEFAGIVEVSAPDATSDALIEALRGLESDGMQVQVAASVPPAEGDGKRYILHLELTADDRPGIVREVSQALASRGVNVHELATLVESAPMAGDLLFRANARLEVPAGVTPEELSEDLEKIAPDLMVDWTPDP